MNHLDVGLDKGFSKTNLAVARADGHLLLETRVEHFDQTDAQPITAERLLHLIAQHLTPFKAHPLYLFVGGYGLDVQALEVFTDVHTHYGLTDMPGNAVTVACGSHWNAMYYDRANNVHCFASPRAIWDDAPHSFEGITFARFLLAWWCEAWDRGTPSPLADEILARTGLSPEVLQDTVEHDPLLDMLHPAHWLAQHTQLNFGRNAPLFFEPRLEFVFLVPAALFHGSPVSLLPLPPVCWPAVASSSVSLPLACLHRSRR